MLGGSPDSERGDRIASVLAVIDVIFNEATRRPRATTGCDRSSATIATRPRGRGALVAGLASRISEVHGLVALMEIQASVQPP
jgi:predicted RNA polymerase sigma factor